MHAAFALLFAVPIREALVRLIGRGQGRLVDFLAFVTVLACGAVHEIGEWMIADTVLGLAIAAALRRGGAHETTGPDGGGGSGLV